MHDKQTCFVGEMSLSGDKTESVFDCKTPAAWWVCDLDDYPNVFIHSPALRDLSHIMHETTAFHESYLNNGHRCIASSNVV